MFLKEKKYLRNIQRFRIAENRDVTNGLRMDRNEKVDVWPSGFFEEVLKNKGKHFFSMYPDLSNIYAKLAGHLGVKEENILISSGIDGCIKTIFEILIDRNDYIGVFSPTYAMYNVYADLFEANIHHVSYKKDFTPDWETYDRLFDFSPKVLFLPNPNQPIESCFSIELLEDIARKCYKNNCLLVIDEAYHYFGAQSSLPLHSKNENVITMRTFSKAFGIPSARIGYMVTNEDNMALLSKTRLAHETNSISAAMAEHLLDNFEKIQSYVNEINMARSFLKENLKSIGIDCRGDYGNYLLICLKDGSSANNVVRSLYEKKIYVKGPWKEPWANCFSITLPNLELSKKFFVEFESIL